jgi:hypothetical protein
MNFEKNSLNDDLPGVVFCMNVTQSASNEENVNFSRTELLVWFISKSFFFFHQN